MKLCQNLGNIIFNLLVHAESLILIDVSLLAVWAFFLMEHHEERAVYALENVDAIVLVLLLLVVQVLEVLTFRFLLYHLKIFTAHSIWYNSLDFRFFLSLWLFFLIFDIKFCFRIFILVQELLETVRSLIQLSQLLIGNFVELIIVAIFWCDSFINQHSR